MACCIVRAELKVHVEEREEQGSAIESEGKEELMCNATHVRQSARAVNVIVKIIHNLL